MTCATATKQSSTESITLTTGIGAWSILGPARCSTGQGAGMLSTQACLLAKLLKVPIDRSISPAFAWTTSGRSYKALSSSAPDSQARQRRAQPWPYQPE